MKQMKMLVLRNQDNYTLRNAFILKDDKKSILFLQDMKGKIELVKCTNKHAAFGYLEFKFQEIKIRKGLAPNWYRCPFEPISRLYFMSLGMPLFLYTNELHQFQTTLTHNEVDLKELKKATKALDQFFPGFKTKIDYLIEHNRYVVQLDNPSAFDVNQVYVYYQDGMHRLLIKSHDGAIFEKDHQSYQEALNEFNDTFADKIQATIEPEWKTNQHSESEWQNLLSILKGKSPE